MNVTIAHRVLAMRKSYTEILNTLKKYNLVGIAFLTTKVLQRRTAKNDKKQNTADLSYTAF